MKNPYEEWRAHPEELRVQKRWSWIFSVVFIVVITLPPVWRNLHEAIRPLVRDDEKRWVPVVEFFRHPNSRGIALLEEIKGNNPDITRENPNMRDHLRSFETEIEKAPIAEAIRRQTQEKLTAWFGEGNTKTVLGNQGQFYLRAAIDGLVGYGPLKPEPDSVMKDPDRPVWTPPLPVIEKFASQLKERGIELMLVPMPVKPMIYPEDIGTVASTGPVLHRDQEKLYAELREAGVEVLDLSDLFWSMKKDGQVFLKQDTHWTQSTMQRAAEEVANKIKSRPWFTDAKGELEVGEETLQRKHEGDQVKMLDLAKPGKLFDPETQSLKIINDRSSGLRVRTDPQSSIVLLGDSFVNIYDDPGIGFGDPDWLATDDNDIEPLIGAGFAQHLAAELQTPLDTISKNGGGATQVRKEFAKRPDNVVRAKKLVVWLIASRDLLLSETPGLRAGVQWRDVIFNTRIAEIPTHPVTSNATEVVIEAELKERTALIDPKSKPYTEAIYSAFFSINKTVKGDLKIKGNEFPAYLWGFRKDKVVPSGRLEVGKKYRLTLVPWASKTKLQTVQVLDNLKVRFDFWFVENVESVEE